jgi:UDP-N-acetylmuramoyl-tripeptide--D-alanyl-D-alanine ligase
VTLVDWIALGLWAAALVPLSLRWLRVAQREHYIAPWVSEISRLWDRVSQLNTAIYALGFVALVTAAVGRFGYGPSSLVWFALAGVILAAVHPIGLGIRGRTAKLAWTTRLKRLAVGWAVLYLGLSAAGFVLLGALGLVITTLLAPSIMDLALAILKPIEKRLSNKYLVSARKKLKQVGPRIVAITGSYGKTSTKGYVAHLLSASYAVVASPASFNNLLGLSRAVNDRLVPGTEVFVAEMGVYGTGEIRELSKSFPPDIAAITTIGEAHLARMKSRETIFRAKSEITEQAKTVVLPIDDPMLAKLAMDCIAQGKKLISVSTVAGKSADVVVADGVVTAGLETAPVTISNVGHAVNIAVAVGIAVALDIPLSAIASRLNSLPDSAHRAEVQEAASGVLVVDDTYNSNPVGAERAVEGAAALAAERGGDLVVVTPGMVELGHVQAERNRAFAASVASRGGHLFAIGRTNRAALVAGVADAAAGTGAKEGAAATVVPHPVRLFDRREQAVAAALDQAGDRGVILYENDLPDHYP